MCASGRVSGGTRPEAVGSGPGQRIGKGGEVKDLDETFTVSIKKLHELSEEIMLAAGDLLKNENGPGRCDTQAIRRLLNVADELLELPRLQAKISDERTTLC